MCRHVYLTFPGYPAFIADGLADRAGGVILPGRQAADLRHRAPRSLAVERALHGLSPHLLRDIGIDLSAT